MKKLGPWPKGIDMISSDGDIPATSLRTAVNVDIDKGGVVSSRPTPIFIIGNDPENRYHSLFAAQGIVLAGRGSWIVALSLDNNADHGVGALNSADKCSFDEAMDGIIVSNRTTLLKVNPAGAGSSYSLTQPKPSAPAVSALAYGGLDAGAYAVAVSTIDDQGVESALSDMAFVTVAQGGGIGLSMASGAYNVYRTPPNGDVLYFASAAAGDSMIGTGVLGKQPQTKGCLPMQGGEIARLFSGRLLTVRGSALFHSEPFCLGLMKPTNFTVFPGRIVMMQPSNNGVFVGTRDTVYYLSGADPSKWSLQPTGSGAPVPHASAEFDLANLDPGMRAGSGSGAIWLSENGFVVGTPDGGVMELQRTRLKGLTGEAGSIAIHNRRVRASTGVYK